MATITTSATGKKKIIYKQDADGVFRLKKIPTDDRIRGKEHEGENAAEDHLNELIGCTYQVLNSSAEDSINASPTPDVALVCPKDTKFISADYEMKQKRKPTKIKNKYSSTSSIRLKVPDVKTSTEAFEKMTGIHVPSFAAGCLLTLVFVSSSPLISHYTSMVFNVIKLGLFWVILLGGITWYSGVVKIQESEAMGSFLNGIKNTFFETEVNEEEEEEEKRDYETQNGSMHDQSSNYNRKNSSEISIPNAVPRRRSASPVKSTRTPLTSVTPFKSTPPKQDSRFQSNPELVIGENNSPPKLSRFHTSDPKGYTNQPKKSSILSLGKMRRLSNNSLELTKTKTNQSIPSVELIDSSISRHSPIKHYSSYHDDPEELPFINEVKLRSSEDDFGEMAESLPHINSSYIQRLNSVMSKQSVLGTRANYNKFLANVQGSDAD